MRANLTQKKKLSTGSENLLLCDAYASQYSETTRRLHGTRTLSFEITTLKAGSVIPNSHGQMTGTAICNSYEARL